MGSKTLKLWRTFIEGGKHFRRNGWLTFATVSILTLSLFIIGLSFLLGVTTHLILQNMKDKVSITVSFNPDVSEERILEIKNELSKYKKEVASVEYISRDQALKDFLSESGNDPVIAQAIEEIGENPLLASLIIRSVRPEDYEIIATEIQQSAFHSDINRINYAKNKRVFERLNVINTTTRRVGIALGSLFAFISILITFNTIRITIYSHRQEFEIMRLVGASNLYVRMPFVFEGAFYGLSAALVALLFLFGVARYISPLTQGAIAQGNFLNLYTQNFWSILFGLSVLGITLGIVSSAIALRRYLRV